MTVLVDTPVWSMAFRRHSPTAPEAMHLTELIRRKQVAIVGPIRQKVLSGIRSPEHFAQVRDRLRSFVDLTLSITHLSVRPSSTTRAAGAAFRALTPTS